MRLDHLLSKEEEVRVVLLFSYQAASARWLRGKERESLLSEFFGRADRRIRAFVSIEKPRSGLEIAEKRARAWIAEETNLITKISGGDACRGHTRSHPEHDG